MTTNLITSFPQFKAVFLALMITDASDVATKLGLQESVPIRPDQVRLAHVNEPAIIPHLGVGGMFETEPATAKSIGNGQMKAKMSFFED
jgi:hypothetical protein